MWTSENTIGPRSAPRAGPRSAPGALRAGALCAAGRRGARSLVEAVVPPSMIVWRGPVSRSEPRKRIALTFDDGPSELTPHYLAALKAASARATFFVVGAEIQKRPEMLRAIVRAGHELGGHGYTHRAFPSLSRAELRDELVRTAAFLPDARGGRLLSRPPYGLVSIGSVLTSSSAGFTTALWSFDSEDWHRDRPDDLVR